MFYRAHENSDGSGLGLFIVSEIIQKMNGQIKLESSEVIGTTFRIQVPLMKLTVPVQLSLTIS
jgi:signal transduction histidine kinase